MEACCSYAIGDVVKPKKKLWVGPVDGEYIITDCSLKEWNEVEYGINGCAWFDGSEITLVSRATKETLQKAVDLCEDDTDE